MGHTGVAASAGRWCRCAGTLGPVRRIPPSRALAALLILPALGLVPAGCASVADPHPAATGEPEFPLVTSFDYQLGGAYELRSGSQLVVRDRTAAPAAGAYSVCYINAFQTQPDDGGSWPREALLTVDEHAVIDPDWPDEQLLDSSTAEKRRAIAEVVTPWIEGCANDGFDAVEFDNLDSFTRSEGALSLDDNLALADLLARSAHSRGLAVGQKNSAEHAELLRDEAGFDFAVAEECAAYDECPAYTEVYGTAVIDIEYTDELPRPFDEMCEDPDSPTAMILRDRDLRAPDERGYVRESCPA